MWSRFGDAVQMEAAAGRRRRESATLTGILNLWHRKRTDLEGCVAREHNIYVSQACGEYSLRLIAPVNEWDLLRRYLSAGWFNYLPIWLIRCKSAKKKQRVIECGVWVGKRGDFWLLVLILYDIAEMMVFGRRGLGSWGIGVFVVLVIVAGEC